MAADAAQASTTDIPVSRPVGRGAVRARLYLASFEGRVAAAFLDALVLFIIASLLVTTGALIILVSSDFERIDPASEALIAFWAALASIPAWQVLYLFICWAWRGQTVGAIVMQTAVVRSDGRPLGLLGATARVIGILTYAVVLAVGGIAAAVFRDTAWQAGVAIGLALTLILLGLAWSVFDPYRRTLHDRLAGTVVIRTG